MKKLILAAAVATLFGSSAFAQSYNPEFGTANIAPVYTPSNQGGYGAYAQAAPNAFAATHRSTAAKTSSRMPAYGVFGGEGWYSQDGW